ncbi:transposase [Nocardia sp. NBC_00881]|uniref:IS110 family transposase n=1 Tax=Nocardia sp. NBC_00881 TaxID=2975995 RepID=UPI003865251C|nr:transposase [Nocardia sp. NBC_00881]
MDHPHPTRRGNRTLLGWARQWPERTWAVENAVGLGHHLAQWLVAAGEAVVDVAPAATARVRQLSRGGRRKNDRIDAAAAASVARCTVMPARSTWKRTLTPSPYSMSDGKLCPRTELNRSTNCTRCCASCCRAGSPRT